jgi:hypothetical protein
MNLETVKSLYKAYEDINTNRTHYEQGIKSKTAKVTANAATQRYEKVKRIHQLEKSFNEVNYIQGKAYSILFDIHNTNIALQHAIKGFTDKAKEILQPETTTIYKATYDPSYLYQSPLPTYDKRPRTRPNRDRSHRKPHYIIPKHITTNFEDRYPEAINTKKRAQDIGIPDKLPTNVTSATIDKYGNSIIRFNHSFGNVPIAQAIPFRTRAESEPKLNGTNTRTDSSTGRTYTTVPCPNDTIPHREEHIPWTPMDHYITNIPEIPDRDINDLKLTTVKGDTLKPPFSLQQIGDIMAKVHRTRRNHIIKKDAQTIIIPSIAIIADIRNQVHQPETAQTIPDEKFVIPSRRQPTGEPTTVGDLIAREIEQQIPEQSSETTLAKTIKPVKVTVTPTAPPIQTDLQKTRTQQQIYEYLIIQKEQLMAKKRKLQEDATATSTEVTRKEDTSFTLNIEKQTCSTPINQQENTTEERNSSSVLNTPQHSPYTNHSETQQDTYTSQIQSEQQSQNSNQQQEGQYNYSGNQMQPNYTWYNNPSGIYQNEQGINQYYQMNRYIPTMVTPQYQYAYQQQQQMPPQTPYQYAGNTHAYYNQYQTGDYNQQWTHNQYQQF